jgi:C4-dicarboxylate-binding protein DctP
MVRTTKLTTLLAASVFTVAGFSANAADFTLKLAHVLTADQPSAIAAERVAKEVAEKSGGRLEIQILPAGQLGSDVEIIEQIQMNSVQIGFPPTAKLGNFEPRMQLTDLPFIFPTRTALEAVLDGDVGEELLAGLDKQGLKGICFWGSGYKQITTSVRPIAKVEDLKGIKMRTMQSPLIIAQYKAWGSNPIPISFGETYNALQQGVAEAQENSLVTIDKMKFYEVQKYLAHTNHAYLAYAMIINAKAWKKLPADLQKILADALMAGRDWSRDETDRQDGILIEKFRKALKVQELSKEARDGFVKASLAVHAEFADVITRDLLDRAYKAIEGK